jgi:hypothetical protein
MTHKTIRNPETNRNNNFLVWDLDYEAIRDSFKSGRFQTARDLSWALLNDDESVQTMEDEMDGDSAGNNFALSVFETALDWTLGVRIVGFFDLLLSMKKNPRGFEAIANRKGDVYLRYKETGSIYGYTAGGYTAGGYAKLA